MNKTTYEKLGIKSGMTVITNWPESEYRNVIGSLPECVTVKTDFTANEKADFIHLFVNDEIELDYLFSTDVAHLGKSGALWISWKKLTSKTKASKSALNENGIRETGLRNGLVDVKVCSVSPIWSALKFVYRLKDRD